MIYNKEETNVTLTMRQLECEILNNRTTTIEGPYCPSRFDTWSCWPDTPAGTTANQSCPDFIVGFYPNRLAFHKCEKNGEWFVHPGSNHSWANYTQCVNSDDYDFRQKIILIHTVGYSVSIVALCISIFLLAYFKTLRCARITIHMNLFASFAINNFLWLISYNFIVNDVYVIQENPAWCRLVHIMVYYFLLSTYSWMFCEGLYLHTVLVSAFISESRLLRYMVLLGWGIPSLTILIYGPTRYFYGTTDADIALCWTTDCSFTTILQIPVAITILLNVIFLTNIVKVLLVKLKRGPANAGTRSGASRASLQALRATMLLVPLLGLNYLLIPFRPEENHPWEHAYEVVSAVTASLQGLCVAILFCFCNGEVIAQVKRKWMTVMFRPRANSCTATTVSFVRSSYPANGEEKV